MSENCIFKSWADVKPFVQPLILSKKDKSLEHVVWLPWMDLAVCCAICFPMGENMPFKVQLRVTRQMTQEWGISKHILFLQAMANQSREGYKVQYMLLDLVGNLISSKESLYWGQLPDGIEDNEANLEKMIVLTNSSQYYGAAVLLDKQLLRTVAAGQNMYIFPSSVHEVIMFPAQEGMEREELDAIVQFVNRNQVPEEEQLSDHAYYYDFKTEELVA